MEAREIYRIASGMEVYDRDNHKLGTVVQLHELEDDPQAVVTVEAPRDGYVEVATGLLSRLGLVSHLFVPLAAVRDVTEGGVFLAAGRAEIDQMDWHTRPDPVEHHAESRVAPVPEVVYPADTPPVAALENWAAAAPYYRRRWEAQQDVLGEQWEAVEPRYRFAWEMARLPGYDGEPWPRVRPELRGRWEVQHPEVEWDTVADTVRDAWEHVAGTAEIGTAGAPPRR